MDTFFNEHGTEIIAIINLIVAGVLIPMARKWLDNHLSASRAERVEKAVQSGLQAAIASVSAGKNSRETISSVLNDPTTRNNVVALAQDYVQSTVPQTVEKLGVSDAMEQIISARVEEAVAKLAERYTIANSAISSAVAVEQKIGPGASV